MAHIIGFPILREAGSKQVRSQGPLAALRRFIWRGRWHSRFPNRIWQRHSALLSAAGYSR